jgi:hypothetical protein
LNFNFEYSHYSPLCRLCSAEGKALLALEALNFAMTVTEAVPAVIFDAGH